MNLKIIISAIIVATILGCTDEPGQPVTENIVEKEKPLWVPLDANLGGFALKVFVPTPEIAKGESKVEYLEDSGELSVSAGEKFGLIIFEDESQMNMMLNEIENHPFYKSEIISQTDSTLLYRYYLENGNKEVWNFYTERSLGQPLLIVRSNQNMEFDEFYARKMLESSLKMTSLN